MSYSQNTFNHENTMSLLFLGIALNMQIYSYKKPQAITSILSENAVVPFYGINGRNTSHLT